MFILKTYWRGILESVLEYETRDEAERVGSNLAVEPGVEFTVEPDEENEA